MKMPLISVIIPVYNCEKYLPQCVESVLAQTYTNLQIILIDDGSKDNSGKICDAYATKDPRVEVIHQSNMGVSAARNVGLKAVRGEYIGFVDSDDTIHPQMYQILLEYLQKYQVQIVACNSQTLADRSQKSSSPLMLSLEVSVLSAQEEILTALASSVTFKKTIWNKLYAKQAVTNVWFDLKRKVGEDTLWLIDISTRAPRVALVPVVLYNYRRVPTSATNVPSIKHWMDDYTLWVYFMNLAKRNYFTKALEAGRPILLNRAMVLGSILIFVDIKNQYSTELNQIISLAQSYPNLIKSLPTWKQKLTAYCLRFAPKTTIWMARLRLLNSVWLRVFNLHPYKKGMEQIRL